MSLQVDWILITLSKLSFSFDLEISICYLLLPKMQKLPNFKSAHMLKYDNGYRFGTKKTDFDD